MNHEKNTDVEWLNARVIQLTSPVNLALVAKDHKMKPIIRMVGPSPERLVRFAVRIDESLGE